MATEDVEMKDPNSITNLAEELLTMLNVTEITVSDQPKTKQATYCPYSNITQEGEKQKAFLETVCSTESGNRAVGCMVGMGIADAVGHPFEFLPVVDTPTQYVFSLGNYTDEKNAFQLERGQWTDDAAMGLCMADSLILKRQFDGSDMRMRFWNWWFFGYNNAFRNDDEREGSVGLGGNISGSLYSMKLEQTPKPVYKESGSDAGNGSLMRLASIPIRYQHSEEECREYAKASSLTTHPGPIAYECCRLMSTICIRAIRHEGPISNIKVWLEQLVDEYLENVIGDQEGEGFDQIRRLILSQEEEDSKEISWNWKSELLELERTINLRGRKYNGYPVNDCYYGAFSIDGLAMALHTIYTTDSFESALTKIVNFCGDADSTGSMVGQMAGAIYGYNSINPLYISNLNKWDDGTFALRGGLLYAMSLMDEKK